LAVLTDDLQRQRADLLRALTDQTEASNGFRSELQQLGRNFSDFSRAVEKGNSEVSSRISELSVHLAADARESHKLLATQLDEQKRLRDALDSYNIEERLAEAARSHQRALSTVSEDMQHQRAEIQRALTEQTESNNRSRGELRQIGGQLDDIFRVIEGGNAELSTQLSELTVHSNADARQSHKLLEQMHGDLQQLDSLMAGSCELMEKTTSQVCGKISELTGQVAIDAKGTHGLLDDLGVQMRRDLQQLAGQLAAGCQLTEKGHEEICSRISELTSRLNDGARASREQLDTLGSQLRTDLHQLSSRIDTGSHLMEKGSEGVGARISELTELLANGAKVSHGQLGSISDQLRDDLRQIDRQLDTGCQLVQKGSDEISIKISELIASMARGPDQSPGQDVVTDDEKIA
ncbi:MAG: hypothetical protein RQ724_10045, partial [Desulfuromonadales bacterium]|nr:hypothetical protein [Desulfuromonadales bacterium]